MEEVGGSSPSWPTQETPGQGVASPAATSRLLPLIAQVIARVALGVMEPWPQKGDNMSDQPGGPDWWQASDRKWYPPQLPPPPRQPPPPHSLGPPSPRSPAAPPSQGSTPVVSGAPKRSNAIWVVGGLLVVVVALVALATSTNSESNGGAQSPAGPSLSQEEKLVVAFVDGPAASNAEPESVLNAITPVADSVCALAVEAESYDEFGFVLGVSYAAEESLADLFSTNRSYGLFAAAALEWRCPAQADRLGS